MDAVREDRLMRGYAGHRRGPPLELREREHLASRLCVSKWLCAVKCTCGLINRPPTVVRNGSRETVGAVDMDSFILHL